MFYVSLVLQFVIAVLFIEVLFWLFRKGVESGNDVYILLIPSLTCVGVSLMVLVRLLFAYFAGPA